jgi:threonine-phosphate decarboxylase
MGEYVHGGNAAFEPGGGALLDLSANINPLGFPEAAARAMIDCLAACAAYPDSQCRALRKRLGQHEGVPPEWLFCGGGASDILFRLPRCVGATRAWTLSPTFADYERSVCSHGATMVFHPLTEERGFAVTADALEHLERTGPDLVFLCNPNNPTGLLTRRAWIEEALTICQAFGGTVVVDECFLDFAVDAPHYSALALLERYENLVVVKAFTKIFALPGLRLGYAVTRNRRILEGLAWHGPDWAASVPAQAAGLAALEGAKEYLGRTVRFLAEERARISAGLAGLGCRVFDGAANYLFFCTPEAFDLIEALDSRGIRIRSCANYRGLSGVYYRVAVSTREANGAFLAAMDAIAHSKEEGTPWQNR